MYQAFDILPSIIVNYKNAQIMIASTGYLILMSNILFVAMQILKVLQMPRNRLGQDRKRKIVVFVETEWLGSSKAIANAQKSLGMGQEGKARRVL